MAPGRGHLANQQVPGPPRERREGVYLEDCLEEGVSVELTCIDIMTVISRHSGVTRMKQPPA